MSALALDPSHDAPLPRDDRVLRPDPLFVPATATCHACGREAPEVEMLRSPAGPECMACSLASDATTRARSAFWKDLRHGAALLLVVPGLLAAAILASGLVPAVPTAPWALALAAGSTAGYGAAGLIWGAWAAVTGGDRRLEPGSTRRGVIRLAGALVVPCAALLGLGSLGLVALAWLG